VRFLSNADVMACLDMPLCLEALRAGYADLVAGDAAYIPRIDLYAPTGRDDDYYRWGSMTGACRTYGVVACRMKSDVLSWPDGKTEEKYCMQPGTYSGIILVWSIRNGEPLALIQDGYLQHMRVGGCAGLGAETLARPDACTLAVIGSGGMARAYLEAIALACKLERGRVYSPTPAHRARYCEEMEARLGIALEPADTPEAAVRGADVVITATDALAPTFDAAWVAPGAHVTCVSRRELSPALLERADVVVQLGQHTIVPDAPIPGMEWPSSAVAAYVCGQPEERARIPRRRRAETPACPSLLDVRLGRHPGRVSAEQVSLLINSGTQGLQFAAVAGRVVQVAAERGLGQGMPLEWFLQDIRD
jgi:alanine dehydrogenase